MANQFYEMFANFGDRLAAGQNESIRANVLAKTPLKPDGTPDYAAMSAALLKIGDREGAVAASRLVQSQAEDAATRAFRERSLGLQEQGLGLSRQRAEQDRIESERNYKLAASRAGANNWDVRMVKGPDGVEKPVRINLHTGETAGVSLPEGATTSGGVNPYATGKFNEGQGAAAMYADRIAQAEDIFSGPFDPKTGQRSGIGAVGKAGMSRADKYKAQIPFVGNELITPEYRQYDQAARNFINATLRRESGAAIGDKEFENARIQYLPQPGDDEQTLANKAANRRAVFEGMAREGGASYRPPPGYTGPQRPDMAAKPVAPPAGAPSAAQQRVSSAAGLFPGAMPAQAAPASPAARGGGIPPEIRQRLDARALELMRGGMSKEQAAAAVLRELQQGQ